MTNFFSWNYLGFTNKWDDIKDIIFDHHPICFAFQEAYLKCNDKVPMRGYNCFSKDVQHTVRATNGVAFLISKNFPHTPFSVNTSIQAIAIQIHIKQLITVCTVYLPPNEKLKKSDLNNLIVQLFPLHFSK